MCTCAKTKLGVAIRTGHRHDVKHEHDGKSEPEAAVCVCATGVSEHIMKTANPSICVAVCGTHLALELLTI